MQDPKTLAGGLEKRSDEQLRAVKRRSRLFLQGLSIVSALLCSMLVLPLGGGLAEERLAVETVASPTVTGPPVLPEMTPGFDT